jgi:signal transduction histidine kinase
MLVCRKASDWLDPTSIMRAATLHSPPEPGNYGTSAGGEHGQAGGAASDSAAATGPQRSLEASSFINLGPSGPRMEAVFDALPIPAIVAYRDGSDLVLNPPARALLSLGEHDRVRSIDELHAHVALTPVEGDPVDSPLVRAMSGERVHTTVRARVQDAVERCWVIEASPIHSSESIIGAVCTIRDITERQLDEEMGDDLLGRASHDLRTPLTALKASAQLIARGFERLDENARQRTLALLLAQIDKLASRIDEVMDASRIRRGRVDVHAEEIDVTAVLGEVIGELTAIPGMPKCELIAPGGLHALGDRARVRQIVKRLAVDAASRGTERIAIEAARVDNNVTITIDVVGEKVDDGRSRTARRLAAMVLRRLGGAAAMDRDDRLVLTLPAA